MGIVNSSINYKEYAFRIYKVIKGGPLEKAGELTELEDFILTPKGYETQDQFSKYLQRRKGIKTKLSIYSMASRQISTINIIPDDSWTNDKSLGLIGAKVRYEKWIDAHLKVLRVTNVYKKSQLERLGIRSPDDYIIALKRKDGDTVSLNHYEKEPIKYFQEIMTLLENQSIDLYIYNSSTDNYRTVSFLLKKDSNGHILGGDLSIGEGNQFPIMQREKSTGKFNESTISEKRNVENDQQEIENEDEERLIFSKN